MIHWAWLLLAFAAGAWLGFLMLALCTASAFASHRAEAIREIKSTKGDHP